MLVQLGDGRRGRKRKRGGGGSWRSYLHTHLRGKFTAAQMQALRRTYLELSDEERAFHNSQGRMGIHGFRQSSSLPPDASAESWTASYLLVPSYSSILVAGFRI